MPKAIFLNKQLGMTFLAGLLLIVLGFPVSLLGEEIGFEKAFDKTARFESGAYQIGRGFFERQGKETIPFLQTRLKSADWRERALARALILRIEEPKKVAAWRRVLYSCHHVLTFRADGTILVKFDPKETEEAKAQGRQPPPMDDLIVDRQAVPVIVDFLREQGSTNNWLRSLDMLKHFAEPESAPALLHFYDQDLSGREKIVDALVRIGEPALPLLRNTIRDPSTEHMSAAAALAVGRLKDREGARLLVEKLKQARSSEQVESFSTALGHMQFPEGMPVVFSQLLRAVDIHRKPWGGHLASDPEYKTMRQAMLAFGKQAVKFLREFTGNDQPLPDRVLATSLLFEIEHPRAAALFHQARKAALYQRQPRRLEDPSLPSTLLIELAYVEGDVRGNLERLTRLKEEPLAFDVLVNEFIRQDLPRVSISALSLAETGDVRVLEVYRQLFAFERESSDLVEGMLILGSPKAVPLLEAIIRRAHEGKPETAAFYKPAAELAKAALPALQGNHVHLRKLLKSDKSSVRAAAARYLARQGDIEALPALLELLSTSGGDEQNLREAIVRLGQPALGPLEKARETAANRRVRLIYEIAALEIAKPELADRFYNVSIDFDPEFYGHPEPSLGAYERTGRNLARALGKEAVPFLEAAVVFQADRFAIFALAHFKEERSIPILIASIDDVGGQFVAHALQEFGEKGSAAAKKIPPPDPHKENYSGRAERYSGATQTLTLAKDVKGVDNILTGLQEPRPEKYSPDYYSWCYRMETYLHLAANYRDKRLLESAVKVLEAKESRELCRAAIHMLADYDDPHVVPILVKFLGAFEGWDSDSDPALKGLVQRLKTESGPFLVKKLRASPEVQERVQAAHALGHLVFWRYFEEVDKDEKQAHKARADTLDISIDPLAQALQDKSPKVQSAAADALVEMTGNFNYPIADARPVKPLIAWARSQKNLPFWIIDYLVKSGEPAAGAALLAVYRASERRDPRIAEALGKLRHAEATADLSQGLDERIDRKDFYHGLPELESLGKIGKLALPKVYHTFKNGPSLDIRVSAAEVLGRMDQKETYPEVLTLFDEIRSQRPRGDRLTDSDKKKQEEYRSCLDSLEKTLIALDPKRTYPLLCRLLMDEDDFSRLGWTIEELEAKHPALKEMKVLTNPLRKR